MECTMDLKQVTRFEVIDENGRAYVVMPGTKKIEFSLQDDGKTLKVFVFPPSEKKEQK